MRKMMSQLWNDDAGIVSLEYLLVATIISMGVITGLAAVSNSLNEELIELATAILAINQSYSYNGVSTAHAYTSGSSYTVKNNVIGAQFNPPSNPLNSGVGFMP